MVMKTCILREWIRIFVPRRIRNFFYWTSYILICLTVLYYSATIIANNLICFPHRKIWDKTIPGGRCGSSKLTFVSAAGINVFLDIFILALPQKTLWDLKLSSSKKLGLSLIFTIGIL